MLRSREIWFYFIFIITWNNAINQKLKLKIKSIFPDEIGQPPHQNANKPVGELIKCLLNQSIHKYLFYLKSSICKCIENDEKIEKLSKKSIKVKSFQHFYMRTLSRWISRELKIESPGGLLNIWHFSRRRKETIQYKSDRETWKPCRNFYF